MGKKRTTKKATTKSSTPAPPKTPAKHLPKHDHFDDDVIAELAATASWICSSPHCQSLTLGSTSEDALSTKVGEAAHIHGRSEGSARYILMTEQENKHFDNGIWLCARCHDIVDKKKGAGHKADKLIAWKTAHIEMLRAIMLSGNKILPYLRTFTDDGKVAQALVDELSKPGAMYQEMIYEKQPYVDSSINTLRTRIEGFIKQVKHDKNLKTRFFGLYHDFTKYKNHVGAFPSWDPEKLIELRNSVASFLMVMESLYECKVEGPVRAILPNRKPGT